MFIQAPKICMKMTYVDGEWRTSYKNRKEYARRLSTAEIALELRPWELVYRGLDLPHGRSKFGFHRRYHEVWTISQGFDDVRITRVDLLTSLGGRWEWHRGQLFIYFRHLMSDAYSTAGTRSVEASLFLYSTLERYEISYFLDSA